MFNRAEGPDLLARSFSQRRMLIGRREVFKTPPDEAYDRFLHETASVGVVVGPLFKVWPFNMVPSTDYLDLGAKAVVEKMINQFPNMRRLVSGEVLVAGVETAAAHWSGAVTRALADSLGHDNTPPILRVHKLSIPQGEVPRISAVFPQDQVLHTPVNSITSRIANEDLARSGTQKSNHLALHNPGKSFFADARAIIIVDDFGATRDTEKQAVALIRAAWDASQINRPIDIVFVAGVVKQGQAVEVCDTPRIALLDIVHFEGGENAHIQVSDHAPLPLLMHKN